MVETGGTRTRDLPRDRRSTSTRSLGVSLYAGDGVGAETSGRRSLSAPKRKPGALSAELPPHGDGRDSNPRPPGPKELHLAASAPARSGSAASAIKGDEVSPGRLPALVWELNPQKPKEPRLQPRTRRISTPGVCGASRRVSARNLRPLAGDARAETRVGKTRSIPAMQP